LTFEQKDQKLAGDGKTEHVHEGQGDESEGAGKADVDRFMMSKFLQCLLLLAVGWDRSNCDSGGANGTTGNIEGEKSEGTGDTGANVNAKSRLLFNPFQLKLFDNHHRCPDPDRA